MITQIGIIAGEILHYLEEKKKGVYLKKMLKELSFPSEVIIMAIGWMVREGHVVVHKLRSDYKISLKQKE